MSKTLDIWELLEKIDSNDREFLTNLPDEKKRGFAPIVALRWLSGSGNTVQLNNLNELVNPTVFGLHKHPELLYNLMVISTPPGKKKYNWVKTKKREKRTKRLDVISRYLNVPLSHAKQYLNLYSSNDIIEMSERLGDSTEFIKDLKQEFKG